MTILNLTSISYSLSQLPPTLKEWRERLLTEILTEYNQGQKVILYPELFLIGLAQYWPHLAKENSLLLLKDLASYTWGELLPELATQLPSDLFLCLGTGAKLESNGTLTNTAPLWFQGKWNSQSKIHLTPWETIFSPGGHVTLFEFDQTSGNKLTIAVLICFDIEQPGLALQLKQKGVDLILVPSATTDENGNQRINRCGSGRSIELGAAVLTSPLVGDFPFELIDHHEGRQGFFLPAQEAVKIKQLPCEQFSEYSRGTHLVQRYALDLKMMKEVKTQDDETKPYFKKDLSVPII